MAIDPYSYSTSVSEDDGSYQVYTEPNQPSIQFSVEDHDSRAWSQAPELVFSQNADETFYSTGDSSIGSVATSFYQPTPSKFYQQQKLPSASYDIVGDVSYQQTHTSNTHNPKPYERNHFPTYAEVVQSTYRPASQYFNRSDSVAPVASEASVYQPSTSYQAISMGKEASSTVSSKSEASAQLQIAKTSQSISPDLHFPTVSTYHADSTSQLPSGEMAEQPIVEKERVQRQHGDSQREEEEAAARLSAISKSPAKSTKRAASAAKQTRGKSVGPSRKKKQEVQIQGGISRAVCEEQSSSSTPITSSIAEEDQPVKHLADDDGLYVTASEKKAAKDNEQIRKALQ